MYELKITGEKKNINENGDEWYSSEKLFVLFKTKEAADNFINNNFEVEDSFFRKKENKYIYNITQSKSNKFDFKDIELELFKENIECEEQDHVFVFFDIYDEVLEDYRIYNTDLNKDFINDINKMVGGFDSISPFDKFIEDANKEINEENLIGFHFRIWGYYYGDEDPGYGNFIIASLKFEKVYDLNEIRYNKEFYLENYENDY